jgi:hypothetical protein
VAFGILAYSHVLFGAMPLGFPDLSAAFAPWALASLIVGAALLIAKWRIPLLVGAIYGFAAAVYWFIQLGGASRFYADAIVIASVLAALGWLLALRGWLLPVAVE